MTAAKTNKALSPQRREEFLNVLKARIEKNMNRHAGFAWAKVKARLETRSDKLWSLSEMEGTGGEPDVVGHDTKSGEYIFFDCSPQSPKGRTSLCYDREALDSRKQHKPKKLGEFDAKSSSWLRTPADIRKLGGAIFGDRRFGRVFVYHNGAESYYSGRGFRGSLRV